MTSPTRFFAFWSLLALSTAAACTAPRTVLTSGKVTPVGEFRGGSNTIFNIPTNTTGRLADVLSDGVRAISNNDSVSYLANQTVLNNVQKGAIAWALDPISSTQDLYLRYGMARRFDVGARVAAGAFVGDVQYQLMGSTGDWRSPGAEPTGASASIGLMFATQTADIPGRRALNVGAELLDFAARRSDILVPLTISAPLGKEEEFGHVAAGLVVGRSFLRYKFKATDRFVDAAGARIQVPAIDERRGFMTYGIFVNGKFGYRYVFVQPALAIYYQNYGTYPLLQFDKTQPAPTASMKGATFVPSLGIQISIPTKRRR
jgi:hypothetical protein